MKEKDTLIAQQEGRKHKKRCTLNDSGHLRLRNITGFQKYCIKLTYFVKSEDLEFFQLTLIIIIEFL